jgi:cell filamentation protein
MDNKFGLTDRHALRNLEDQITPVTIPEALKRLAGQQTFGLKQVQIAHKEIFGEIYPWAGQLRTADISKEIPFLPFELIKPKAAKAFADFRSTFGKDGDLAKGMADLSDDGAAFAAASLYNSLNFIHPFREGNGRANRAIVTSITRLGGYDLDWTKIASEKDAFNAASLEARRPGGSLDALSGLFHATIVAFDPVTATPQPESKRQLLRRLNGVVG